MTATRRFKGVCVHPRKSTQQALPLFPVVPQAIVCSVPRISPKTCILCNLLTYTTGSCAPHVTLSFMCTFNPRRAHNLICPNQFHHRSSFPHASNSKTRHPSTILFLPSLSPNCLKPYLITPPSEPRRAASKQLRTLL